MPCSHSIPIRRSAFEKLATLAVKSPALDDGSELARLAQQSRSPRRADGDLNGVLKDQAPTSRVPMVCYPVLGTIRGCSWTELTLLGYPRARCSSSSLQSSLVREQPGPCIPTRPSTFPILAGVSQSAVSLVAASSGCQAIAVGDPYA